jgi:hypothetical protein
MHLYITYNNEELRTSQNFLISKLNMDHNMPAMFLSYSELSRPAECTVTNCILNSSHSDILTLTYEMNWQCIHHLLQIGVWYISQNLVIFFCPLHFLN